MRVNAVQMPYRPNADATRSPIRQEQQALVDPEPIRFKSAGAIIEKEEEYDEKEFGWLHWDRGAEPDR
jgi:hypothetical protein